MTPYRKLKASMSELDRQLAQRRGKAGRSLRDMGDRPLRRWDDDIGAEAVDLRQSWDLLNSQGVAIAEIFYVGGGFYELWSDGEMVSLDSPKDALRIDLSNYPND